MHIVYARGRCKHCVHPAITCLSLVARTVVNTTASKTVLEPLDETMPPTDKINSKAGLTWALFL